MDHEFTVFYYIDLLKKWRKPLLIVVVVSMVLTIVFSLTKPPTYVSTVTLLLAGENPGLGAVGSLFGISDIVSSDKDVIIAILKSNRMANDIREEFKLSKKPNFWWGINTYVVTGGLNVEVKGPDPALTEKIANFCIQELDKINTELNITLKKPMVKVLDPAGYGARQSGDFAKRTLISGIFAFLALSCYIFFLDYLKRLKRVNKP
jgi:uncharacterized protein involved in exopolysaccharide biosynthesis